MWEGVLERAGSWLLMLGVVVGFLLLVLGGALPERAQSLALWIGMSLMLGGLAGALAWMAWGSPLEWRGISPAVSVLVGVLAGLAPFAWQHLRGGHGAASWKVATVSAAAAPAVAQRRPATAALAVSGSAIVERSRASTRPNVPTNPQLERALIDLGNLLDEEARPAVNRVFVIAVAAPRNPASNPTSVDTFRVRVTSAAQSVAQLQASLERFKTENSIFAGQLDTILGGATAPFGVLNEELERFGRAVESAAEAPGHASSSAELAPAELALKLRADASVARRWVEDCKRRIAEQRAAVNSG